MHVLSKHAWPTYGSTSSPTLANVKIGCVETVTQACHAVSLNSYHMHWIFRLHASPRSWSRRSSWRPESQDALPWRASFLESLSKLRGGHPTVGPPLLSLPPPMHVLSK